MNILLVINKANREFSTMESIRREILVAHPGACVDIREMFAPHFVRFVFNFRPDVILTFP